MPDGSATAPTPTSTTGCVTSKSPVKEPVSGGESLVDTVPKELVPEWVKNNAEWWADGQISDSDFISGIEYLVLEGIIHVSETDSVDTGEPIPDWVKNNAKWWSDGQITEKDFVNGIEYLIKIGIITV